jgi:hypothetical protein
LTPVEDAPAFDSVTIELADAPDMSVLCKTAAVLQPLVVTMELRGLRIAARPARSTVAAAAAAAAAAGSIGTARAAAARTAASCTAECRSAVGLGPAGPRARDGLEYKKPLYRSD